MTDTLPEAEKAGAEENPELNLQEQFLELAKSLQEGDLTPEQFANQAKQLTEQEKAASWKDGAKTAVGALYEELIQKVNLMTGYKGLIELKRQLPPSLEARYEDAPHQMDLILQRYYQAANNDSLAPAKYVGSEKPTLNIHPQSDSHLPK